MKVRNSITDTDDELVKLRMMEAEANTETVPLHRGDETAFEYFCKMLPDDARISKIISWLKSSSYHPAVPLIRTLCTLDRDMAGEVFEQTASSIFGILMMNDDYFQFAHQLWTVMGHLVVEDESKFSYVVFELWEMAFDPGCDDLNYTRCDQINDFLLEIIWSNASDELKAHVSDTFWRDDLIVFSTYNVLDDDTVFSRINFASYYGHDMTFTLEMMSKLRDVDKKELWKEYWPRLVLRSKPLYLEKFMRMCLSNDDKIERFKNKVANFKGLFESLVEEGLYADLKEYLLFCSKDVEEFQQLGKKVLGWNLHLISFYDDDRLAKLLEWFVSEVLIVNIELEEFKRQMISSTECVKNLLSALQTGKIRTEDFSRIIRRFVNDDEEELQQVKRKLLEHSCTYPVDFDREYTAKTPNRNRDRWQEFFVWCTTDLEDISTFKRSLKVDDIFLERVRHFLDSVCVEVLDFLDSFLKWYFGNEEDTKNFKLDKVKNYKHFDILRVEIEKDCIYVEGLLYELLVWLFDGNRQNVVEFCKSCNCPVRSLMDEVGNYAGF